MWGVGIGVRMTREVNGRSPRYLPRPGQIDHDQTDSEGVSPGLFRQHAVQEGVAVRHECPKPLVLLTNALTVLAGFPGIPIFLWGTRGPPAVDITDPLTLHCRVPAALTGGLGGRLAPW